MTSRLEPFEYALGRDRGRCVMKELVEVIAKSLVENPDEVVVTETEKG